MRPSFTLGIEEEYQTIDPETRDLRSHIATEMLTKGKLRLEERVKAEMHQSVIEVGTRICSNIQVAQEDLFDLRRNVCRVGNTWVHLPSVVKPKILNMLAVPAELHALAVHVIAIHRDMPKAKRSLNRTPTQPVGFADLLRFEQYQA